MHRTMAALHHRMFDKRDRLPELSPLSRRVNGNGSHARFIWILMWVSFSSLTGHTGMGGKRSARFSQDVRNGRYGDTISISLIYVRIR